jgi:hypothetical protein
MIKDFDNCRLVEFGNGTVTMGIGSFDKRNVCFYVHESNYSPINGERVYNENAGKRLDIIDKKSISLNFTGPEAIKSIDLIIEDLNTIKNNILNNENKDNCEDKSLEDLTTKGE